jgi:hypothetical protein
LADLSGTASCQLPPWYQFRCQTCFALHERSDRVRGLGDGLEQALFAAVQFVVKGFDLAPDIVLVRLRVSCSSSSGLTGA